MAFSERTTGAAVGRFQVLLRSTATHYSRLAISHRQTLFAF